MERASMPRGPLSRFCRVLGRVLPIAVLAAVSACTPYSTYPPDDTGEAMVPWMYPMPQLMSKSLRATYDKTASVVDEGTGGPVLRYLIPDGISVGVWDQVGIDSGIEGARRATEEDLYLGVPIWTVEQVRVRNLRAEVDVIFPVATGYERATVILESEPFRAFEVKFFQRWRVPVDAPILTSPKEESTEVEVTEDVEVEVSESTEDGSTASSDPANSDG